MHHQSKSANGKTVGADLKPSNRQTAALNGGVKEEHKKNAASHLLLETGVMPLNGIGSDVGVSFVPPRPPTIPSFPRRWWWWWRRAVVVPRAARVRRHGVRALSRAVPALRSQRIDSASPARAGDYSPPRVRKMVANLRADACGRGRVRARQDLLLLAPPGAGLDSHLLLCWVAYRVIV